jgi:phosphoglycolate phosphatase-like HAD superfamily hydrolase
MKALVLDFDGVIADSARESFAVAVATYRQMRPGSGLTREEGTYKTFVDLMPLGNRAEDYGVILAAIESKTALPDQAAYDAFRASEDPDWLRRYHRRFYAIRAAMARKDPAGWRALMPPYPAFVDLLKRRAGEVSYALATAKDRGSVESLLREYGIAELFLPERIMDKEAGTWKAAHLEALHARLGVDWREITFVDDKVNHLDAVSPLGVRCALAAWGYNGPREWALAGERGYVVCTLEDAESRLFGG